MYRIKLYLTIVGFLVLNLGSSMAESTETCEDLFSDRSKVPAILGALESNPTPNSSLAVDGLSIALPPTNEDFLSIYFGRNPETFDILKKIIGGTRRTSFFTSKYYLKLMTQALSNSVSNPEEFILRRIKNDFRLRAQSFSPSRQQLIDLDLSRKEFNRIRSNFGELLAIGKDAETLFKALYYFSYNYSMKFIDKTSKTRIISPDSIVNRKLEVGDRVYYIRTENDNEYRDEAKIEGIDPNGFLTLSNGWYNIRPQSVYVSWGCYRKACVGDEVYFRGAKYTISGIFRANNSLFTITSGKQQWWRVSYSSLSLIEDNSDSDSDSDSIEEITEFSYSFKLSFWRSIRVSYDLYRHFQSIKPMPANTIAIPQDEAIQLQDLSQTTEPLSADIDGNTSPSEIASLTRKFMERLTSLREDIVTLGINVLQADTQYFDYLLDLQGTIEGGNKLNRAQFNQIFGVRNGLVAKSIEQIDSIRSQIRELEKLSSQMLERLELIKGIESNSSPRSQNFYSLQVDTIQRISNETESLRDAVRRLETQSSNELFLIRSLMSSIDNDGLDANGLDFLKELIRATQ